MPARSILLVLVVLGLAVAACAPEPPDPLGMDELVMESYALSRAARADRAAQIRDAAADSGVSRGWLLAGIAEAETGMSHCWSELTWACRGPSSSSCGGGPVVAGAGDGPCSARQGGLGMFQFDGGTYDQTLRRDGARVLSIAGNVEAAVEFVVAMVIRSAYVAGVETTDQAIEWLNGVTIGGPRWDAWIRTVTHYYNGCAPSYRCFSGRYAHYRDATRRVHDEMGAAFWALTDPPAPPPAPMSPPPTPEAPPTAERSCAHSLGGTYASRACSASYQCCDGAWRSRGGCGDCACVEETGRTGCTSSSSEPPAPPAPPASAASCTHMLGGVYGHLACSPSYQCCNGTWRSRSSGCGTCACTEESGATGCRAP